MPSSGRGRILFATCLVLAHVVPAAVVWAVIGAGLAAVPTSVGLLLAIVYAGVHGCAETFGLRLRAPEVSWAVPSAWLRGRSPAVQAAIWGVTLGPGLVTRNPYAGMWFVPLLLALGGDPASGVVAGVLVGATHGVARAAGILANHRRRESAALPWEMMILHMRIRRMDGIALLFAAAGLVAIVA